MKIYEVKFKGIQGVGFVGGKDEDDARKRCNHYTAKLVSIKFSHKMEFEKKKGNK